MNLRQAMRTVENLDGIHPKLAQITWEAIWRYSAREGGAYAVAVDGLRTLTEQQLYVSKGKSWTLNSKHLSGLAVDIVIFDKSTDEPIWAREYYASFRDDFEATWTDDFIEDPHTRRTWRWGGDWSVRDYGHFEIDLDD